MGWLEDMLPFQVPNAAGDARRDMEPQVASYRGDNGRFDPTALTQGMPPEVQSNADMIMRVGEARRQAQEGNRPEPLSWNKWLGGALQEISVPVAYAQGNQAYGAQMMPNTILKQDRARQAGYEDERRSALSRINDDTATGVGNAALEYTKSQRDRRRAAKEMIAKSIAAASVRGPEAVAEATKMASQYLRGLGLSDDAAALERMSPAAAPSAPPAAGGPSMAPPGAPSGVPGTVVTPPSMPGGSAPQAQGMPQASGPPLSSVPLSPKRRLAELVAPYNEEAAKSLMKEAEIEEAPGLEGAKELAKQSAQERVKLSVAQPGEERALRTTFDTLDGIETTIDDLLSPDGQALSDGAASNVGGLWDTYVPNRPGGEAANSWAKIEKLKSNIGVMVLNAMREASKTGGAVGNVTEKEWPILQNQLASLSPDLSDEEFAKSLLEIKKRVSAMRLNTAQAFDGTYGTDISARLSTPGAASPQARTSPEAGAAAPTLSPEQSSAIKDRYAKADPQTQQSILESLKRRGIDPQSILAAPPAGPPKPWYQSSYEEGFHP